MQTGISTASLFPRSSTDEALKKLKALGADCAEVFFSTFYEYRPEFSKSLAGTYGGLNVHSVHCNSLNFEGNLFNPSRRVRGDGMYWLDQLLRSAQLLGCKFYTFHGFHRLHGDSEDDFGLLADRLGEAVAFARSYGVTLALENVCWSLYDRPGVFSALKSRIPDLRGVFDIKQARRSHHPWQAYLKDMSGSISYAHLSDVDADGRTCLPGEGICDFCEIFRALAGEGFSGPVIVEVYGGDYAAEVDISRSLVYLRECADRAGL